jgi:hypothetical protein
MKEDSMLVYKTQRILLFKKQTVILGQDGMLGMSRMNKHTNQVNTIHDMASIVIETSILSPKEMVDTSLPCQDEP